MNNQCETARYLQKGVTAVALDSGDDGPVEQESELVFETSSSCLQCESAEECELVDTTCQPNSEPSLCFRRLLLDGTVIEAGCASYLQQSAFDRGVEKVRQHTRTEICLEENCNSIGSEEEFLPNYDCKDEDDSISSTTSDTTSTAPKEPGSTTTSKTTSTTAGTSTIALSLVTLVSLTLLA